MLIQTLTKRLNRHKLAMSALALVGIVLAMLGTLFMKLEYQTTSRFIIIQEQHFNDAFTQAKSAEYVSEIFGRVVGTDSFRQAVFEHYTYLTPLFPENKDELRKAWNKSIEVAPDKDTGIISISAYNSDRKAAEAVVFAVGDTLTNNVKTYLGKGAAVEIKPIDGPITSDYPARPSFVSNAVAGGVLGLLLGVALFGLRDTRQKAAPFVANQTLNPGSALNTAVAPVPPVPAMLRERRAMQSTRQSVPKVTTGTSADFTKNEFEQWLKRK